MTDDMWGTGDYQAVAEKVTSIAEVLVGRAHIESGMRVLDVACGTGNATIAAAELGARVTGLDFSPRLITIAREQRASRRMSRSSGSKGMLSRFHSTMTASTGSSLRSGTCSRLITGGQRTSCAAYAGRTDVSRLPVGRRRAVSAQCSSDSARYHRHRRRVSQSPLLWGTEAHVRELLGEPVNSSGITSSSTSRRLESYADFMLTSFPPLIAMRAELGDESSARHIRVGSTTSMRLTTEGCDTAANISSR